MKKIITIIALSFSLGVNAQTNLYTEGADLSNTMPGTNVGTCNAAGTYTISGTLTTPSDGQDWFQFTVANGYQLTNVTYAVTGAGSFNGGWNMNGYNSNSITGIGTGTMDITPFTYPQPSGTYFIQMFANFSVGNSWAVTLTIAAIPPGNLSFDNGSPQSLNLCENATATDITSDITVTDDQAGETLQWTLSSAPTNGTVVGLPQSITSVNGSNNPSGAVTYQPAANFSGSDAFNITVSNGTNSVVLTVNVTVNSSPAPVINSQSGSVDACGDVSATFSVSSAGTNTYAWYWASVGSSVDPASATLDDGSYNETGYTTNSLTIPQLITNGWDGYFLFCVVTNTANCTVISNPDTITVNALPTVVIAASSATVCAGVADTLTVSGATSYTWSTSATTNSVSVTSTITTQYTVTGTDANGCMNTDTLSVIVQNCTTDINKDIDNDQISVYPNPTNGIFTVETNGFITQIQLYDICGKTVLNQIINNKTIVDVSDLTNGVYQMTIKNNGRVINRKLIVSK